MKGTAIYIWHDGRKRYDEVAWDPKRIQPEEVEVEAAKWFEQDHRATRIQIQVGVTTVLDVMRAPSGQS